MIGQGGVSPVLGTSQGDLPQWHGIYYGLVSSNADPRKKNRCRLRVPQLIGKGSTTWAVSLTPQETVPKVGTIVAVMFLGGDIDYPCYLIVDPKITTETDAGQIQPVGTTASAGTSVHLAAADHVHTLANALESLAANIKAIGAVAAGTSSKAARADHVHALNWVIDFIQGIAGQLSLDSGSTGVADNTSDIVLKSKNKTGTGSGEIDLNTDIVVTSDDMQIGNNLEVGNNLTVDNTASVTGSLTVGNGTTSHLILNPQMAEPPNYPLTTSGGTTQVNQIAACVNGLVNSLINHELMV
jgi:hypothetical protein